MYMSCELKDLESSITNLRSFLYGSPHLISLMREKLCMMLHVINAVSVTSFAKWDIMNSFQHALSFYPTLVCLVVIVACILVRDIRALQIAVLVHDTFLSQLYVQCRIAYILNLVAQDRDEMQFAAFITLVVIEMCLNVWHDISQFKLSASKRMRPISYDMLMPYLPKAIQGHLAKSGCTFQYIEHTKEPKDQYIDSISSLYQHVDNWLNHMG
ncbi:hypothetical protein F5887DRAFT_922895 [Amanita rubescens]|nr:hypothetical protein F5887DRAFT_922895 [Amanita rubescens]